MPSVAPDTGAGASDVLLERASLLEELNGVLAATATGGRVVLVVGETGIGKSALVKWFTERQSAHAQFLLGACDPLLTPHALGPLHDIARQTGGRLAELLVSGAPAVRFSDVPDSVPERDRLWRGVEPHGAWMLDGYSVIVDPMGPYSPGRSSVRRASCTPPSTWTPPERASACSTRWPLQPSGRVPPGRR
jgi:hypothetical protein